MIARAQVSDLDNDSDTVTMDHMVSSLLQALFCHDFIDLTSIILFLRIVIIMVAA